MTVPDVTLAELDAAFTASSPYVHQAIGPVGAGILPHHELVGPLLAAFFLGLHPDVAPSTIVILGPDHPNIGNNYATTGCLDWQTPYGTVQCDDRLVSGLLQSNLAGQDETLLAREHGVYTIVPYLRRVFPKAKIVQIALKGDQRPDRLEELAKYFNTNLGPNDLVLASVDFSHYKNLVSAWQDDDLSLRVIRDLDPDAALNIPVDSPPAISLLLRYVRLRNLKEQQLLAMNSAEFTNELSLPSTTSYLNAYFVKP